MIILNSLIVPKKLKAGTLSDSFNIRFVAKYQKIEGKKSHIAEKYRSQKLQNSQSGDL